MFFCLFLFCRCVFWVCFCSVLCVCWSGLGVVLVLLCLVCLVCAIFCFFVLVSSESHENHCFPCKSSVLGLMLIQSLFLILVPGSCFFLLLFYLFLVSRCSFVSFMFVVLFWLNHKVRLVLICMLFSCSVLWVLSFVLSVLGLVD